MRYYLKLTKIKMNINYFKSDKYLKKLKYFKNILKKLLHISFSPIPLS